MSMTGEVALSTHEETAFGELAESYAFGEDAALAVDGLTSVMRRAQATASEQIEQTAAGISDVNAQATAFQSN